MFHVTQKYTAATERFRGEQDAVDAAFRSGDLSALPSLPAATLRRSIESFERAAQHQRKQCSDAEASVDVAALPGVSDWLSATADLAQRQEAFARRLEDLLLAPIDSPTPLEKSPVKSTV